MSPDKFRFPEHIEDYLSDHNVMNVSTCGKNGPWSSAVFFSHQNLDFWFMSSPHTRHGMDIVENGIMAGSIHEDYVTWREIKGIQMEGKVWAVRDMMDKKAGLRAFFRKFCFAEAFLRGDVPDQLRERMRNIELFCFRPELVLWLDNSTGFGNRVQIYPLPDEF